TLSIQVSLDGFSFYAHDEDAGSPVEIIDYKAENTETPDKILLELQQVFEENEKLLIPFKNVQVTYRNELFTIVPEAYFDHNHITDYLKYNTKILDTDFIVYDELKEQNAVVVYIPFANINNFFFDHFGSFSYHHGITIFVEKIMGRKNLSGKEIHIYLTERNFDLLAHDGQQLLMVNTFSYQNAEDFLYHVLFCFEQLNFDPNKEKMNISGKIPFEGDLNTFTRKYIRNLNVEPEDVTIIPEHNH
ncbi:MAG: DUF3822 family protein, partial [Leeuwenhoekiella sp.]